MSRYAIVHDHDGTIRCCTADGRGGTPYTSIHDAETAIKRYDPHPVIAVCDHPHEPTKGGFHRCARTDKPCPIQRE